MPSSTFAWATGATNAATANPRAIRLMNQFLLRLRIFLLPSCDPCRWAQDGRTAADLPTREVEEDAFDLDPPPPCFGNPACRIIIELLEEATSTHARRAGNARKRQRAAGFALALAVSLLSTACGSSGSSASSAAGPG